MIRAFWDDIRRRRLLLRLRRDDIDRRLERGEYVDTAEIQAMIDELEAMQAALRSWMFVQRVMGGRANG